MAHGLRTTSALSGAATGAAAGPFGALIGGAVGYGAASLGGIFGHKAKKPPPPKPWYVKHAAGLAIGGGAVLVGVLVLIVVAGRKANA